MAVGAALEALDGEVDFYASEGVRLIIKLVNDIAKALRNNIDGMILAFKNVWHTIFYALAVALQSVMKDSALQGFIEKLQFYFSPDNYEYFKAANYDPDAAVEAWLADQGPTNLEYLLYIDKYGYNKTKIKFKINNFIIEHKFLKKLFANFSDSSCANFK